MRNGLKWILVVALFGVSVEAFIFGPRDFVMIESFLPSRISANHDVQERENSRLEADARDAKARAAQEAAYTQKYHPNSQGEVMQFPERAIKPEEDEKAAAQPKDFGGVPLSQVSEEQKGLTREEYDALMQRYFRLLAQEETREDAPQMPLERPEGWANNGDMNLRGLGNRDDSWQDQSL